LQKNIFMSVFSNIEASCYHAGKLWLMPPPAGHTPAIPVPRVSTYTFVMVNTEGGLTWTLP
jgi:hypothetical protein